MTEANLLSEWSRLLMESLADAGLTDVVLSPGSRSTPFMIAAAENPRLRCHDSIDERAAAFFALGQARVTGRPSLLICTSGSAGAHYFPAVVEAATAFLPLVVLTADRPFELQDCAAPQTIDQVKLFGGFARHFVDLGLPDGSPGSLRALRRIAAQAVHRALAPTPGPVHLNGRARKPLEPMPLKTDEERALKARVDVLLKEPLTTAYAPVVAPDPRGIERAAELIAAKPHGLIVCGPAGMSQAHAREAVFALAQSTGYPVLAEASSQLRFTDVPEGVVLVDAFDALYRAQAFRDAHPTELVLQLGAPPVSSGWERYSGTNKGAERIVIAPYGWNDPTNAATVLIDSDVGEGVRALNAKLGTGLRRGAWAARFTEANGRAWAAVDHELATAQGMTEGEIARTVIGTVPRGSMIELGNSLAIREVDTFAERHATDVKVMCQRGANGIDGLLAAAAGASRSSGEPITVLIGDVSFMHDLTSLSLATGLSASLVFVVIQNYGGRIFETLPIGKTPSVTPALMSHVTTPHRVELEHAAKLFGHGYAKVTSTEALRSAIQRAHAQKGCTVIEAIVPEHGAVEQHDRLFAAVSARLADLRPVVASSKAPIVALHGFTGRGLDWQKATEALGDREVIAPDLLGHSRHPAQAASFLEEVERIAQLLRARKVEKAHLVGYSLGGRIGLGLLTRHPELFAQATLVGVNPGLEIDSEREERRRADEKWAAMIERDGVAAFAEAWQAQPLFASQAQLPKDVLEAQRARRLSHSSRGLAQAMRVLGLAEMPNFWPALSKIEIPVELVVGERDEKFTALAEKMARVVPRASVRVIGGAGHNVLLERPDQVAKLLQGKA
jgi:2-succinyl-5-enolpyruvyl-6-hydroxy-3-cyclohexene-1-carboxylate synthase